MICIHCGAELPEGAKFCTHCGMAAAPVLKVPAAEAEDPTAAPILDMPQPTAPMYTPVPEVAPEVPEAYNPGYDPYAQSTYQPMPMPQSLIDSIFTWGLLGTIFAFNLSILGIIFSAVARKKSNTCLSTYGYLPDKAKTGRTLSTIGLVSGIVITAIITLYVVFLIAVFAYAFSY